MLDQLVKFASRLRDNGVTTFEISYQGCTMKVMQDPVPPSSDDQKRRAEQDFYGAG